jgi:uncharacterized membrane protein YeaQ/YmgE (transglycosylase-associated protein family)
MLVLAGTFNFGVGLIGWIIAGLIGGWLAGQVSKGSGYGLVGDLIMGIVGALLLGWILSVTIWAGDDTNVGLIGTIVAAFVGALLLSWLLRAFTGRRVAP